MRHWPRLLAALASSILFATACLHASGSSGVATALSAGSRGHTLVKLMNGLWL